MWLEECCRAVEQVQGDVDQQVGLQRRRHVQAVCEVVKADGGICQFRGTATQVGMHRWREHGQANPIKALVLTNECPGCRNVFKEVRSAKEHAARAMKQGRCPQSEKAARPFLQDIQVKAIEGVCCPHCKEELGDHEQAQRHLAVHFRALLCGDPPEEEGGVEGGGGGSQPGGGGEVGDSGGGDVSWKEVGHERWVRREDGGGQGSGSGEGHVHTGRRRARTEADGQGDGRRQLTLTAMFAAGVARRG